ncbi:MAG: DUF4954 family protein [Planctomycetota bacterium]
MSDLAAAIGSEAELLTARRQVDRRADNVLGLLVRPLTRQEIAIMEDRGCRCDAWEQIAVAEDFDPFRVRRTHFQGACVLGRFAGEREVMPGMSLPSGIYDCTLINCQIGNDCLIEKVRFAANVVIDREAVVFDIGSLTCSGSAAFGCDQLLSIAIENGGREVPVWAEMSVDTAAQIARDRHDEAGQAAVLAAASAYVEALRSPVGWVRRGAVVRHTERVVDAYIGMGAVVDNAVALRDAALLSSVDEPVVVAGAASVEHAVLQWGARADGGGILRHGVLLEHAAIDQHGAVEQAIIGPNTTIAKGEVTASLVGPFVGFHHQSLLIAALWPEGKGNVAYGAMVGSNHTGRANDQEIWPGEGTFFGLGCSIRFPTDLSEAPYSVISAGVSTLPQRVGYPFSLLMTPSEGVDAHLVPRAYNEILPAWGLYAGAYGIERAELKFARRDRSRRHVIDYKILRPAIIQELPGLGKNFLREEARERAVTAYRRVLLRYGLRILLGEAEGGITIPGSAELAHELADALLPGRSFAERMAILVEVEEENARLVAASKASDDERGARIIPGYADAHVAAADDPVVAHAQARVTRTAERIAALA